MIESWWQACRIHRNDALVARRGPRLAFTAVFLVGLCAGLYFGLFSVLRAPPYIFVFIRTDHVEHILTFGSLTLLAMVLWRPWSSIAGLMVACAGLLELMQGFSPVHEPHLSDWAFSSLGVALAVLVMLAGRRVISAVPVKDRVRAKRA